MARFKRFLPLLGFAVFAWLLWWALDATRDVQEIPSPLIGKPVAAFKLPTLANPEQTVGNEIFEGQVTLLNFWGSWCFVCIEEHPFLNQLAGRGVQIVGVNYRDSHKSAQEWLQLRGNPYREVLVDNRGRFVIDLGVYGAPETFLIDKRGVIRYKRVGALNADVWRHQIEPLYRQLLAE